MIILSIMILQDTKELAIPIIQEAIILGITDDGQYFEV